MTEAACHARIEGSQNLCTRDRGHDGDHRCLAIDVDNRKRQELRHDHRYEAGPYQVCRRCGDEYKAHVATGTT